MKYFFRGNLEQTLTPVLEMIEHRLAWQPQSHLPLLARVRRLGHALLCLRELEYFDALQSGGAACHDIHARIERLIDRILAPLESEYELTEQPNGGVYTRVQRLRSRILPDLVEGKLTLDEQTRRWRQLTDCYVAQQLGCYPPDYLGDAPAPERLIETVERLEEDLTDAATIHGPMVLVMQVGDAIEVSPQRQKGSKEDPLTAEIGRTLSQMLKDLATKPPPIA